GPAGTALRENEHTASTQRPWKRRMSAAQRETADCHHPAKRLSVLGGCKAKDVLNRNTKKGEAQKRGLIPHLRGRHTPADLTTISRQRPKPTSFFLISQKRCGLRPNQCPPFWPRKTALLLLTSTIPKLPEKIAACPTSSRLRRNAMIPPPLLLHVS